MNKLLLTLISFLILVPSAMAEHPRNIIGIRAGVNFNRMTINSGVNSFSMRPNTSFHVGVIDQFSFSRSEPFYLESGILLSQKGCQNKGESFSPLYLVIPVQISYHIRTGEHITIQPAAGLYYGLLIGGAQTMTTTSFNMTDKYDVPFRRSDMGLRLSVGLGLFKHYYIGAGYEASLINSLNEKNGQTPDTKFTNNVFTVSVGYNF